MKSVPSYSAHMNDMNGENTFVTSALLDIVTSLVDETGTTFIRLVQCWEC